MQRRTFLALGVTGSALAAAAGWWTLSRRGSSTASSGANAILRAIVPAMLAGALPMDRAGRAAAIDETVAGVARAIEGLPPSAQHELSQLFALLDLDVARRAFAGVASPWNEAGEAEVGAFLTRWQQSGWALKRGAYDALHQLLFAAWYGNPRSWALIGYPGPPALATS